LFSGELLFDNLAKRIYTLDEQVASLPFLFSL